MQQESKPTPYQEGLEVGILEEQLGDKYITPPNPYEGTPEGEDWNDGRLDGHSLAHF